MSDYEKAQQGAQQRSIDEGEPVQADLGNAAATQQAAEIEGKASAAGDSKAQQADEAKEAERIKVAKASWEKLLGEKIGGKVFELIMENVSYEDVLGYAKDGSSALGDAVGDFVKAGDEKNPGGVKDPAKAAEALSKIVQGQVDKWIETPTGQRVLAAVAEWVQEHPLAVTAIIGAAAIGAAIGAWVSNMDVPELKKTFKLGKGFEVGAGVDFGGIQDMTVEAAKLSVGYSAEGLKASIGVTYDKEKGTSVKGEIKGQGEVGETKLDGTASAEIAEDGRATVKLDGGVDTMLGDMPASARAKLVQGSGGDKDDSMNVEGEVSFGEKGEKRTVKGTLDAKTGAFSFNLERSFLEDKGSYKQGVSQDADGNTTENVGVDYKDGDQAYGFSQSTGKDGTSTSVSAKDGSVAGTGASYDAKYTQKPGNDQLNLGVGYSLGEFKSKLEYEMKDGMSAIGASTSTKLDNNLTLGANARYSLTNERLESFGARLGWQDPKAFGSFALEYKSKWLQDNSGYEHEFDGMFEKSVGNLSGRLKGGLKLQGSDVTGANVDLLGAYHLNDRNAVLLGGGYEYDPSNPNGAHQPYVQGGWQFSKQNVSVVGKWAPSEGGGNQFSIGFVIPFGR